MTTPTTRTLGKDDWMTPPEVFNPLNRIFRFTGDACAASWDQSRTISFISPDEDALSIGWSAVGPRVFCNPPYGRGIDLWFRKAVNEVVSRRVETVCLLVYANTDTKYWHTWVAHNRYCHMVIFLRPRVRFVRPDGVSATGAPKGSALVILRSLERFGEAPLHRYADWTEDGWAGRVFGAPVLAVGYDA